MQYVDPAHVAQSVKQNQSSHFNPLSFVLDGVLAAGAVLLTGGAALPAIVAGGSAMTGDAIGALTHNAQLGDAIKVGGSALAAHEQSKITDRVTQHATEVSSPPPIPDVVHASSPVQSTEMTPPALPATSFGDLQDAFDGYVNQPAWTRY